MVTNLLQTHIREREKESVYCICLCTVKSYVELHEHYTLCRDRKGIVIAKAERKKIYRKLFSPTDISLAVAYRSSSRYHVISSIIARAARQLIRRPVYASGWCGAMITALSRDRLLTNEFTRVHHLFLTCPIVDALTCGGSRQVSGTEPKSVQRTVLTYL